MLDDRLKGKLKLYISGSQGVAPAENIVTYGIDFNTIDELIDKFTTFINENAHEYIDDYLEDCDYDEDDALMEAIVDSGEFEIYLENDEPGEPSFIYNNGVIEENRRQLN